MFTISRPPTHPGEILRDHYLEPRGATVTAFAAATGVSRKHLSRVLNGHVGVTPDLAVRLAAVLGTSAKLWTALQSTYDLWHAERDLASGPPVHAGAFAAPPQDDAAVEA